MTDTSLQGADLLFDEPTPDTEEPSELTNVEGDATGDEPQPEEESGAESEDDLDGESQNEPDEDSEDNAESREDDPEAGDESDELYLDLDGEEVSLELVRTWKKGHMLEKDYTQARQEDAKREKRNVDEEGRLKDQTFRIEAIATASDDLLSALKKEGLYDEDELKVFETKVAGLRTKLAEDETSSFQAKARSEFDMLVRRNKDWLDDSGVWSEKGQAELKKIKLYASREGYSDAGFNEIVDHRILIAFHKADQFDALKRKSVEVKKRVRKVPIQSKPKPKPKAPPKPKTAEEAVFGII